MLRHLLLQSPYFGGRRQCDMAANDDALVFDETHMVRRRILQARFVPRSADSLCLVAAVRRSAAAARRCRPTRARARSTAGRSWSTSAASAARWRHGTAGATRTSAMAATHGRCGITTQHNTTQHNTTQHNTTQHNTTQHNTTQHNTTQTCRVFASDSSRASTSAFRR
jgi:hypothetical protein